MSRLHSPRRGRVRRHLLIGAVSVALCSSLAWSLSGALRERWSLSAAYVALGLLGLTLSLGPWNLLRGRPNPVSFHHRRDLGLWSAAWGVAHTVLGFTVHFPGQMHLYLLPPPGGKSLLGLRADAFGAANLTGLIAALLLLVLAMISNDRSLRFLGTPRWHAMQRWAYVILGLTVLHGALYQILERQRLLWVLVFLGVSLGVTGMQVQRWWRVGRSRTTPGEGAAP